MSACTSVRLSVCLFTFEVPFNGLFAPTSRSGMSNIFRDSESLGKSSGKKWSQIWTFLFENCLKLPRKFIFFFLIFFTFEVPFNGLFASPSQSRMSNIFRDSESLGKSNGKKWSQMWKCLFENCLKSPRKKSFFFFTVFTFEVPFNGLFAHTSRSWMSNIFRDLESLGKSNGKKWYNIWTFLFGSGLKSPHKKKFFFVADFALVHPPMASVLLSASVERCFVSRMRDFLCAKMQLLEVHCIISEPSL